jgi:outer membrane receptor protein involved in Fe transport
MCAGVSTPALAQERAQRFDIPAQSAADGLNDWARQAGTQVIFPYDAVEGRRTPSVRGTMTPQDALDRLIRPLGLRITSRTGGSTTLKASAPVGSGSASAVAGDTDSGRDPENDARAEAAASEEIVVTGSRLAGNPTSTVLVVKRDEILRSGFTSAGEVIRSLPVNFNGGQNPGVVGAAGNQNQTSISGGSSANLRGLGPGSTLTLINGKRLAFDGYLESVDVSILPIDAIERVEVLTDGASAIYGSDAVAGVVNFILREKFEGLQSTARIGFTDRGGGETRQLSQTAGTNWGSGGILATYEYSQQDRLLASERSVSSGADDPLTLLPQQTKHSAYVQAHQAVGDSVRLSGQAVYTSRESSTLSAFPPFVIPGFADSEQFGGTASISVDLSPAWRLDIDGTFSQGRVLTDQQTLLDGVDFGTSTVSFRNRTSILEGVVRGPLSIWEGWEAQLAFGAGHRRESYFQRNVTATVLPDTVARRRINYVFGEVNLPFLEDDPSTSRHEIGFEVNAAARFEDYSDFGQVFNPKLGARLALLPGLAVRANFAKSFKAPALPNVFGVSQLYAIALPDPASPSGASDVLVRFGANPDLKPERATTLSAGVQLRPAFAPGVSLDITAFQIRYRGRIVEPIDVLPDALVAASYAPFIQRNPSLADQQALVDSADFFQDLTGGNYSPATIAAIVSGQYQNVAAQKIQGIDVALSAVRPLASGTLSASANASFLKIRQSNGQQAATRTLTGTIFNPPAFRARASLGWTSGSFSATGFLNHIASLREGVLAGRRPIGSWTTADLNMSFQVKTGGGGRSLRLSATVQNLFDQAPPRIDPTSTLFPGVGFDSTNANALGRNFVIAATIDW